MEKLLHLSFSAQRMDYIANVLSQRPWNEVAGVMADIQRQIEQQQGGPATGSRMPLEAPQTAQDAPIKETAP